MRAIGSNKRMKEKTMFLSTIFFDGDVVSGKRGARMFRRNSFVGDAGGARRGLRPGGRISPRISGREGVDFVDLQDDAGLRSFQK